MLKIGLTGGIGSGKSAVADFFSELSVPVIDADVIAREVVKAGLPAYDAIVDAFGADVLRVDGELDRGKLRGIVFADASLRMVLENIIHPLVRLTMQEAISDASKSASNYCLVVIPLMIETGQTDLIDQLIVVDAPVALRVKRTVLRDEATPESVEAIIQAQVDGAQRRAAADFIIENTGSLVSLKVQVIQLHEELMGA